MYTDENKTKETIDLGSFECDVWAGNEGCLADVCVKAVVQREGLTRAKIIAIAWALYAKYAEEGKTFHLHLQDEPVHLDGDTSGDPDQHWLYVISERDGTSGGVYSGGRAGFWKYPAYQE